MQLGNPLFECIASLKSVEVPDSVGILVILSDGQTTHAIRQNLQPKQVADLLDRVRGSFPPATIEVPAPATPAAGSDKPS